jgi:hypothetical protein
MTAEPDTLFPNARTPARPSEAGLKLPLEEVQKEDRQPVDKLALLASPHAFDLLGDIRDVGCGKAASAQERRLLYRPGVKIGLLGV